ncbi:50S ribosomal protein L21 [Sphingomonas sp.]|uniref:50S ribosomal protein L21 n=1 Tax=Sphingomonas sp. TaxID=28214 RepID=UPI0025F26F42|nr:50S ribosomal protein L21 [Sphingomonas sp.]
MFAVVRTGGKQYRVAAGDKIVVEKIDGVAGAQIALTDILFAGADGVAQGIAGLTVAAEIIAQAKAEKIIVFKKKRRHNYRRKNGHRQQHTILKILSVGTEEDKASAKKAAAPKTTPKVETEAAPVSAVPVQNTPAEAVTPAVAATEKE